MEHEFLKKYLGGKSFEEILAMDTQDADQVKALIDGIEAMMKDYASKITYTQMRNILQLVKNPEFEKEGGLAAFFRVLPLLAYMEARPTLSSEGKEVVSFVRALAGAVKNGQYPTFVDILNTMVAYHKLYDHGKA